MFAISLYCLLSVGPFLQLLKFVIFFPLPALLCAFTLAFDFAIQLFMCVARLGEIPNERVYTDYNLHEWE